MDNHTLWQRFATENMLPRMNSVESPKAVLGRSVRAARDRLGFSREKLAEMADVHANTINMLERGKAWVGPEVLQRIAGALHTTPGKLMGGEGSWRSSARQVFEVLDPSTPRGRLLDLLSPLDDSEVEKLTAMMEAYLVSAGLAPGREIPKARKKT